MEVKDLDKVTATWQPDENTGGKSTEFREYINKKYNTDLRTYWDLHEWTVKNLSEFWEEIWHLFKVISSKLYSSVLELDQKAPFAGKWFPGSRLNIAENVLKFRDDDAALYVTGENRESKRISHAELYQEACRYGAAFRKLGLKMNDRVACYMHNREEAIFAMLGATSIGAIWTGALPMLNSKAVLNRFQQTSPTFIFTIDKFLLDGEEKHLLENVKEIANGLPNVTKVVIVPSKPESIHVDISGIPNSCFLEEFLAHGRCSDGSVPDLVFEQLPFDHPVFINYTSGTTGNPKPLVHGVGSMLSAARDFGLHCSDTRKSVWLSMSPVGWATWNMFTNLLFLGGSVVLYEGVPFFKYPTSLWDLVDEFKITSLFLTPSTLDELQRRQYLPGKHNSLASLRIILSGGTVVKPRNYEFVYSQIKSDVMFGSGYGTTEHVGCIMLIDRTIPIYTSEISTPSFGISVACLNNEGMPIAGELGELVVLTPAPSQPLHLWNDVDDKLYKKSYLNTFPGYFLTGDLAYINPFTNGIYVGCRSDDTLNQKGCRFGSSEIYNVVDMFPEVENSLCVSQYNKDNDERAVLFLKMKKDHIITEDLIGKIKSAIAEELTKRHVPEVILEAPDIPHNMNGKKMEIVVKKIINRMPCDFETAVNPECLQFYKTIPELLPF